MHPLTSAALTATLLCSVACQSTSNGTPSSVDASPTTTAKTQTWATSTRRYMGYVKIPDRSARMPMTLDLIAKDKTDTPALLGFLKISAGGFNSHEYTTLYFNSVQIDPNTSSLVFNGGPNDIRLSKVTLADNATVIKGELIVDQENVAAPFEVQLDTGDNSQLKAFAGLPIETHLTGHYVGQCDERREILQLEASRWRGRTAGDPTLFGGYRIFGRTGRFDDAVCSERDKACVGDTYPNVVMEFLARTVKLRSEPNPITCRAQGKKLACDGACTLAKDTTSPHTALDIDRDDERHERDFRLPEDTKTEHAKGRSGQYYGYLHHENRDVYQLLALNVKGAADNALPLEGTKNDSERVAAVATLYFGEGDSSEFVAYRFKEQSLENNPRSSEMNLTLDGDGEAIFVIDSWSASTIRGSWYGKTFGRVGTVELARDLVPELPPKKTSMQNLAGLYRGEGWDFEMATSSDLSETEAAFYPLKIFGWAREQLETSRRRTIQDGAYDFYSGALALRLDDGRTVLGQVGTHAIELYWAPVPRLGSPLSTGESKTFKRVDAARAHAKLMQ